VKPTFYDLTVTAGRAQSSVRSLLLQEKSSSGYGVFKLRGFTFQSILPVLNYNSNS